MNTDQIQLRAAIEGAASDLECMAATISSILQADGQGIPPRVSATLALIESFAVDRRNAANRSLEVTPGT